MANLVLSPQEEQREVPRPVWKQELAPAPQRQSREEAERDSLSCFRMHINRT